MDAEEFRRHGREMIDYVANYLENIRDRPVFPPADQIQPGYLAPMLPTEPPQDPETFDAIMADVDRVVMPGVTHWHSPRFFAYYATGSSYPSIVADILSDGIGNIGFSWAAGPSCTELETVMMDWIGKMLQLPEHFLFSSKGKGGGVIHGTASEAVLTALLSARSRAIDDCTTALNLTMGTVLDRLVAFTSDQAHSSVERAGLLGCIRHFIKVPSDHENAMRGPALQKAIDDALAAGLIPFMVVATLGTTGTCAFDNLVECGQVVERYNADENMKTPIWLHVDAAYAGSAFCCPEFRPLLNGVEYVDSFNFNPHKFMFINFDCSAMYFKDATTVVDAFNMDPVYLKHQHQGSAIPDYRHWQIPLGRRFRSLKLFFVLRSYGVKKIQEFIRQQVENAHHFEELVRNDNRFEITAKVVLGLVCFRLKPSDNPEECNAINQQLYKAIGKDNRIHLVPTNTKDVFTLRLAICASRTTFEDIDFAWYVIRQLANQVMKQKE